MEVKLIGIVGKAMSGKDTIGKHLIDNYNFNRRAFADPLKTMCMKHFDLTHTECYVKKTENSRFLLQHVGCMMRDEVDDDYWLNKLFENVPESELVVVTDVRFKNEANRILYENGQLWKVVRDNNPEIETGADHASEVDLDDFDDYHHIIENNSTIEDLFKKVDDIIKEK